MNAPLEQHGAWSSRLGFVLAAAGSAIGLGNIWRFPFTAGQQGGGAFVLLYLLFVALLGVPVLLSELAVGRHTQKNAVGAFKALFPATKWPWLGGLGVLAGFGILSFYSVIAGLTVYYVYRYITGGVSGDQAGMVLGTVTGNNTLVVVLTLVFLIITALVVQRGVSGGIERTAKVLMPIFFVILLVLAIRSLTLEGAGAGLSFLFSPDFSKLNAAAVVSALGQALFSLSIGMGAMITYGSYISKQENVPGAGITVAFCDTAIAILAGVIIFPAVFALGASPAAGPGLVFVTMPSIFDQLPLGVFFGLVFYLLLAIAALTSTISLLEVIVAYFIGERRWSRRKATWTVAAICFVVAVPSALSMDASHPLGTMLGGTGFLGLFNIIWGNYALSIGAVGLCIFVGWKWGIPRALAELEHNGHLPGGPLWGWLVRYICPVAIALVLIYAAINNAYL